MSNKIGRTDDVTSATDKLMMKLLAKAETEDEDTDFQLSVIQAATRWSAVKNRLSVPEEGNAFDGWRADIARTAGAGPTSAGQRTADAGPPRTETISHRPRAATNGSLTAAARR